MIKFWYGMKKKRILKKNNYFKNVNFVTNNPINWQPKLVNNLYRSDPKCLKIGIIFPIPISKEAYTKIGYKYYEENYENVVKFVETIQNKLSEISVSKNINFKLFTKMKRSYNTVSDNRFEKYLKDKKVSVFEHQKLFMNFFQKWIFLLVSGKLQLHIFL